MQLVFPGLKGPISILACDELLECVSQVLYGWPFDVADGVAGISQRPAIVVKKIAEGYRIHTSQRPTPEHHKDKVDMVCAFIAELVGAWVARQSELLCLHGAAVELNGKLVVFLSGYRAGKSTLITQLAALDMRVYADDVLPIQIDDRIGLAPGIAPRLRLPLPPGSGVAFRDFVNSRWGFSNERYLYLNLRPDELASFGTAAEIGAFVLLERGAGGKPTLEEATNAEMLQRLILQNFAQAPPADRLLDCLHSLVNRSACFRLRYSDSEEASRLLLGSFKCRPDSETAAIPRGVCQTTRVMLQIEAEGESFLRRNPAIQEKQVDGELFLVNSETQAIHHLDKLGAALWSLLDSRTSVAELVRMVQQAFPEISKEQIQKDLKALMSDLIANRLLLDETPAS